MNTPKLTILFWHLILGGTFWIFSHFLSRLTNFHTDRIDFLPAAGGMLLGCSCFRVVGGR